MPDATSLFSSCCYPCFLRGAPPTQRHKLLTFSDRTCRSSCSATRKNSGRLNGAACSSQHVVPSMRRLQQQQQPHLWRHTDKAARSAGAQVVSNSSSCTNAIAQRRRKIGAVFFERRRRTAFLEETHPASSRAAAPPFSSFLCKHSKTSDTSEAGPLAAFDASCPLFRACSNSVVTVAALTAGGAPRRGRLTRFSTSSSSSGSSSPKAAAVATAHASSEEKRRREAALLQIILPRSVRTAFPYVLPVFRPLVLLASLPAEQQLSSEKSKRLRLAAARRAHALLPPFTPDTEQLWRTYTRWLLTDPAAAALQQQQAVRVPTKATEAEAEKEKRTDLVGDGGGADNDAKSPSAAGRKNSSSNASSGSDTSAALNSSRRQVRIEIALGELLGQLFVSKNLTLQASWKLLFAAVEPTLQQLLEQQSLPLKKSVKEDIEEQTTSSTNRLINTTVRLLEAANRLRYDWTWGAFRVRTMASKDLPALERAEALRMLHAFIGSTASGDVRLCARLVDAFVFLWRDDLAQAHALQPTESLQVLQALAQKKQLLMLLPERSFIRDLCRSLHCYLHLGLLTPLEKTQAAVVYGQLKIRHLTFFRQLAAEIKQQQQDHQKHLLTAGRGGKSATAGGGIFSAENQQQRLQAIRRQRLAQLQQRLLVPSAAAVSSSFSTSSAEKELLLTAAKDKVAALAAAARTATAATAAGEKEWKYAEFSRLDYVTGCGLPRDFVVSGVVLQQQLLPFVSDAVVKRLAAQRTSSSYGRNSSCGQTSILEADPSDEERSLFFRKNMDFSLGGLSSSASAAVAAAPSFSAEKENENAEKKKEKQRHEGKTEEEKKKEEEEKEATARAGATTRQHTQEGEEAAAGGVREYTTGQMAVIGDSMLFLNLHNETHIADEVISVVGVRLSNDHRLVQTLDPRQCVSVMVCFGEGRELLPDDSRLLQLLTERFVDMTLMEIASAGDCMLFCKALVKWSTRKVVERHATKRYWKQRKNTYVSMPWLHAPATDGAAVPSASLLLLLCKHICKHVHSFKMRELTSLLRSVAFLGFSEEKFFRIFVDFFIQRLGDLTEEDIANITNAFNRAGVEEPFLFSLMGKRFQQLQAKLLSFKQRGVLRRIG